MRRRLRAARELRDRRPGERAAIPRPYVAVWVEDKDGLPGPDPGALAPGRRAGPRWHADLKRWYREDQAHRLAKETSLIDTISRPTRPPGKYSVTWDGKNDHGKPLVSGACTVCIEAAREHGTYRSSARNSTIADTPFAKDLKGNVEIESASIEYRPKGAGRQRPGVREREHARSVESGDRAER